MTGRFFRSLASSAFVSRRIVLASSERSDNLVQSAQRRGIMNTKSKMVLAAVAGAALGAAAVQGLHAQGKPKAYLVTESEILDQAALDSYMPGVTSALPAGGGRFLVGPGAT
jgi:hypothetical protein